jgi:hypothetical protein
VSPERTTWGPCASLVDDGMGPEGPITWLPTLNRGREGLEPQGLTRVVTDTPVTTRAVAKATRESGRKALRALASPSARHASPCIAGWFTRVATDRRGARWPHRSRLSGTPVEPASGGAVGIAWRPTYARSGSSRDVRSLYDRPRFVKRSRGQSSWYCFKPRVLLQGLCFNARIERDARVSQPGDPRRASHRSPPGRRDRVHSGRRQPTTTASALKRGKVAV